MNDSLGEMNLRRITLADGRYLIFYEFSGDIDQIEVADTQSEEAQDQREIDRGSSV
ncbi:MAG TPA: hypothetical protein VGO56_09530 [Pyrinomonadaceae bacterium]|jgi:hypothetical protein|nr:hypothetical protein [Pyrinomonadaceae bacterium]